jgi:hypothetical protein
MKIISFFQNNILPIIVDKQRRVYERFGLPLQQIYTDLQHGAAMDAYLKEYGVPNEGLMFVDIDCIPLEPMAIPRIMNSANFVAGVTGLRQNHGMSRDYAGPACLTISQRAWHKLLGKNINISMKAVLNFKGVCVADVAYNFTQAARKINTITSYGPH